ncbi:MAG TPA: hypothetical protein VEB68_00630 [Croceibacterium sp.]|nr:hypothetical protein [Croceibacterium sp.]
MSMTIPVAQLRIARDISEAEKALDEALIKQSSLFTTMVAARRETGSDPFVGHEALLRLAKSQQALLEAGGNLARVHGSLLDVQREMCGADECPPNQPRGSLAERQAG